MPPGAFETAILACRWRCSTAAVLCDMLPWMTAGQLAAVLRAMCLPLAERLLPLML